MGFWSRCGGLSCPLGDVCVFPATPGIQREFCTAFHLLIPAVTLPLVWLFSLPSLEASSSSTKPSPLKRKRIFCMFSMAGSRTEAGRGGG